MLTAELGNEKALLMIEIIEQGAKEAEVIKQGTRTDLLEPPDMIRKLVSGGTDASYLARRIAREAQKSAKMRDVLERMKAGEFKCVRAASAMDTYS